MCVAAVAPTQHQGDNSVITEVEDTKRRAGRALGLGRKASAYQVQRGLASRGQKELAREFEGRNKGRRGAAHAESQLAVRVEQALLAPPAERNFAAHAPGSNSSSAIGGSSGEDAGSSSDGVAADGTAPSGGDLCFDLAEPEAKLQKRVVTLELSVQTLLSRAFA